MTVFVVCKKFWNSVCKKKKKSLSERAGMNSAKGRREEEKRMKNGRRMNGTEGEK